MWSFLDKFKQELRKIKRGHNVWKEDGYNREQQDNSIQSPPWSDLHVSLLDQIAGNLCFVDQVIFHAVCKSWNAAQYYKTRPADLLPWVVRVTRDRFRCQVQLYARPLPRQPYALPVVFNPNPIVVQDIYLDKLVSSYRLCRDRDIEISCNYGWMLFSIPTRERDYTGTIFVFYSPFTKEVLVLPRLTYSRGKFKLTTGFSAEPDSPNFVLLVVRHSKIKTIHTYCHGQGKWNTKELDDKLSLSLGCPSPDSLVVYTRELFFFVEANGLMRSYNITSGGWKRECASIDRNISTSCMTYAFESNSELMLVHHSKTFEYGVRRFDCSARRWLPLNNLGDRTLFVSVNFPSIDSFCYKAIDEEEEEPNNLVLPNEIHLLRTSWHSVYNLKRGKVSTYWLKPPNNIVTRKH